MKGRRTTANSSDRFWEDRRKGNESEPALKLMRPSLRTDQRKNDYRIIDKVTKTAEPFHKHQLVFLQPLYHYIISLWNSIDNIRVIKASVLEWGKHTVEQTLMLGTSWALITGICEVYFYIRAGWIVPKITAKIISCWIGSRRNHDNILIHPISSC